MAKFRVIIPNEPFLDADAILRSVENALTGAAASAKIDFDTTTRTWNERPAFVIQSSPGIREVFTQDKIYFFLNQGTAVRHALMSPGFRPKTRHGYIGSNMGQGGKLFVSRRINLPGIEAREFDIAVQEKWNDLLPTLLQRAIDSEVSRQNNRGSHAV